MERDTKIIAVAGKGGVGKSSVTTNLAVALAERGKKVVIFDADFGLANVEVMFGKMPQFTLNDVVFKGKQMAEIITEGPMEIGFISGGSGIVGLNDLQHELEILQRDRARYEQDRARMNGEQESRRERLAEMDRTEAEDLEAAAKTGAETEKARLEQDRREAVSRRLEENRGEKQEQLREILSEMEDELSERSPEILLNKVASASCKAAVKGNNTMSYEEADGLVRELMTLDNPYACPHGRPTLISMTKREMEKRFKRIV
mgnify:CR=1 FL=1